MTIKKLFELVQEEEERRETLGMERGYPLTKILFEENKIYKMDFADVVFLFRECLDCLTYELNSEGEEILLENIKYWYEEIFEE